MNKNVLTYLPSQSHEAEAPNKLLSIAVVTDMQNNIPVSVMLNELSYNVVGYLSLMPGIVPGMNLGDKVLISAVAEGVLIHGVVTDVDAPARANFGYVEGKLVGAVAKLVGGSGGGKPEIAEAGGKDQAHIDAALQAAPALLADLLG